jgi:ferredoxin
VLLDNHRTRLLADAEQRDALHCIRCGACLNVCPVYRQVGGHAYGWVYSGPVGAVLTPLLAGRQQEAAELANASTLCGACMDACPVSIPLQDLLLSLRRRKAAEAPAEGRLAGVGGGVVAAPHLPGVAPGRRPRAAAAGNERAGARPAGLGPRAHTAGTGTALVHAAVEGRRGVSVETGDRDAFLARLYARLAGDTPTNPAHPMIPPLAGVPRALVPAGPRRPRRLVRAQRHRRTPSCTRSTATRCRPTSSTPSSSGTPYAGPSSRETDVDAVAARLTDPASM